MVVLTVNGTEYRVEVDPERTLLSVLRDDLDLTGTKFGCGEGLCGACTVLIDGAPQLACLLAAGDGEGSEITTIEGLATNDELHPLQRAFIDLDAMQCGYCTPGMILAGTALLRENPRPSADDVREALEGHICRCGTYQRIIAATLRAAAAMRGEA